jgi:serine/threonine protein phosphatase PrpC
MIIIPHSHLQTIAFTHPGMKGKPNEDRYAITAFQTDESPQQPVLLAVLADGIGGHRAGEVAAELAVEHINRLVAESRGDDPLRILRESIEGTSNQIAQSAGEALNLQGMGSTCAIAWVMKDRLYTASVGDSRIYLIRQGRIRQITTDHTWIQEALEEGILKPEQVEGHPNKHVIRRYLGSPKPPEVDFRLRLADRENDGQAIANQGLPLRPGDTVLLCSDGLSDLVNTAEILDVLQGQNMESAAQALVDLACARGGHDNITVLALRMPPPQKPRFLRLALSFMAMLLIVLALALLLFGWLGWFRPGNATLTPSASHAAATQSFEMVISDTPQPTSQYTAIAPVVVPSVTITPPAPGGPTLTSWPTNTSAP